MHRDVLAIVLAGGRGSRLEPLTRDRAKPAVPFGGIYRIIDFTLSNCINSDLRKILVLTQYKAVSLNRHIDQGWKFLSRELDEYIEVIPPQQRIAEHVVSGDRRRDLPERLHDREGRPPRHPDPGRRPHLQDELRRDDRLPPRAPGRPDDRLPAGPRLQASEFGVMDVDGDGPGRPASWRSRPTRPAMPDHPELALASMGIYVFATDVMYELLFQDAARKEASRHDFGKDIIPGMLDRRRGSSPTRSATRTASRPPTGATSARSTPTSRRAWT